MSYAILTSRESSAIIYNAPTFDQINNAMAAVATAFAGNADGASWISSWVPAALRSSTWIGRWVGPAPRVTRTTQPGSATAGYITRAAWLWEWNDANTDQSREVYTQHLISLVRDSLAQIGSWSPPTVVPWSQSENGPIEFWTSGQAATTQTRNEFPTGLSRLGVDQNPVGPTTGETVPTPNINSIPTPEGLMGALKALGIVAGVGLVAYVAWPMLAGRSERRR